MQVHLTASPSNNSVTDQESDIQDITDNQINLF